jgi:hypothetical protein
MSKLFVEAGSEQKIPITIGTEQGQDVIVCVCVCVCFRLRCRPILFRNSYSVQEQTLVNALLRIICL